MASPSTPRHTKRYYWPHHAVVLPLSAVITLYAGWKYVSIAGSDTVGARLWFALALLGGVVVGVVLLMRQHYALGLQDRVIRLEVRQRYFELTGRSLRSLEGGLSMKQLTALRFAPDELLPALVEEAASAQLVPGAIIERIGAQYQPDALRL